MSFAPLLPSDPERQPESSAGAENSGGELSYIRCLEKQLLENQGKLCKEEEPPLWPFPDWTRYRFEAFLGKGAMGLVFKVFDPVLNRSVALKVLNERAMLHSDHFLAEARAMARVDHPNVAKVFEAGEVEGQSYLAMQLLHGESLHTLWDKLSLEERVDVLRQACEGVQAAHRTGLLHRDLKPGNIVVEKSGDGRWQAFVVDFGLACDTALMQGADTDSSAVTGTPAFMSPEQAAGDVLDRRSDVFSLGSTLYAVLTGRAPFSGQSVLSILGKVSLSRPEPLHYMDPRFPQDLEAIVSKAMEKDPLQRYPSAKALAQDLERWLCGEAVEALSRKPFYRLGRWLRKNRLLASLGILLVAALVGVLGLGVRSQWRSRAQARYFQYFCQEAERMEARLALADVMPLHDTRPEREEIRRQIGQLSQAMQRAGAVAEAPGRYALGRGYLALGEWQSARLNLEKAWALGLQTPEVAYALGDCLGQLYDEELNTLFGPAWEMRRRELDRTLKPAIKSYLMHARQGTPGAMVLLAEARLAATEGRFREALEKVDQVMKEEPYNVRARLFKAAVLYSTVARQPEMLARAKGLMEETVGIARSSAAVYVCLAIIHQQEMVQASMHRMDFTGPLAQVLEASRKAREADGRDWRPWLLEAQSLFLSKDHINDWFWAKKEEVPLHRVIQNVIECADRARALNPNAPVAAIKSAAWLLLSEWESNHQRDNRQYLDQAIQVLSEELKQANPQPECLMVLGNCYLQRGEREMDLGENPWPSFEKAQRSYENSEKWVPNPITYYNHFELLQVMALCCQWQGGDFAAYAAAAREMAIKAAAGLPAFKGQQLLAGNHLLQGEEAAWAGRLDKESARLGKELALQAIAAQPEDLTAKILLIKALLLESFVEAGPPDLETVRRVLKSGLAVEPGNREFRYQQVWLALERFRVRPSWQALLAMEKQIDQALKLPRPKREMHVLAFEACRIALQKQAPGATPEQWRRSMVGHLERAKRLNPLMGPWVEKLLKERAGLRARDKIN